jgi:indole-3-glycerol phosphate synthase
MATHLERILEVHRARAAADRRSPERLAEAARESPPVVPFVPSLTAESGLSVIGEIKRRSPSKGWLSRDLDPTEVARSYELGGAAALSVLTDSEFFGGSAEDLVSARRAGGLPVLRKDFLVSEGDVCETRAMGADAVLLIVAALDQPELARLLGRALDLGMDALVEVHDVAEVDRALEAGARLVGINQRDLVTFEVDSGRAERLAALVPPGVVKVAESGVRGPDDARRLAGAGFDAVLVGESLILAADRSAAVRDLVEAGRGGGAGRTPLAELRRATS